MKTLGTLKEWIDKDPEAYLSHPDLQDGVLVFNAKYHPKGIPCTYMSHHPNDDPMVPYFGSQCPYVVKGTVRFRAHVIHTSFGSGVYTALPDELALDDRWSRS